MINIIEMEQETAQERTKCLDIDGVIINVLFTISILSLSVS